MTDLEVLRAALATIGAPCDEDTGHYCTALPKGDPDNFEYETVHAVVFGTKYLCFDRVTGRYLGVQDPDWGSWKPRGGAPLIQQPDAEWHQFGEVDPIKK